MLPAYCEEENLRFLLPRVNEMLRRLKGPNEVIIVDTVQPMDGTHLVCLQLGLKYVRRSPSNSFGDAVRTGIREAHGKWIIFMDSDGSHEPAWIPRLAEEAGPSDIVIASRYINGGSTENSLPLIFMSKFLNKTYSFILHLDIHDVSNSFKLYRADLLKNLELRCQNFDIIEEILFKIKRSHPDVRIKEIPFIFKERQFGKTKRNLFWFMITYLFTIIRLRLFL